MFLFKHTISTKSSSRSSHRALMTHITPGLSDATTELLKQNVLHSPPTAQHDPHGSKIKRHRKPAAPRTNNTHKRSTGFGTGTTLTGVYLILSVGDLEDEGRTPPDKTLCC